MSTAWAFEKWSGAGNDFILMNADALAGGITPARAARFLCARRRSIGADGLILLRSGAAEYWNCDGSPAAFCGNGARCVGAHLLARDGLSEATFSFGEIATTARRAGGEMVVTVPTPVVLRGEIDPASLGGALPPVMSANLIAAGVPHLVLRVAQISELDLDAWAPHVAHHPDFGPQGVNVTLIGEGNRVRTWERGVEGETLACGSGALAAAWVLSRAGGQNEIALQTKGDDLLTVAVGQDPWLLRGPAERICRGVAEPPSRVK